MKKRTLAVLVAVGVLVATAATVCFNAFSTPKEVSDMAVARAAEDVENAETVFLDDEAIAMAADSSSDPALQAMANEVFNYVNAQRQAAGLSVLAWNKNLIAASNVRAKESSVLFSHTRPDGRDWYTVNSALQCGENLAYGYSDASSVVSAWMASPTHKENILWPTFSSMSVSVYLADNGVYYWAQEFCY